MPQLLKRITDAVAHSQTGNREDARTEFLAIWEGFDAATEPIHRCLAAHYLADLFDAPADALRWNLRALEAAAQVDETSARRVHASLNVRAFLPSLHLNLAEDYRRLGDVAKAREHLARGREAVAALPDDGYGRMIAGGLDRLAARLAADAPDAPKAR